MFDDGYPICRVCNKENAGKWMCRKCHKYICYDCGIDDKHRMGPICDNCAAALETKSEERQDR